MAGVRRTFFDTSVLYPIVYLDLFARLAERRALTFVWSQDLLDELAEKWTEHQRMAEGAIASATQGIARTFRDTEVPRASYQPIEAQMPGTDPDDKVHVAAAVAGAVTHIVTEDKSGGFPREAIREQFGIQVQRADEYLTELALEEPQVCSDVVDAMDERHQARDPDAALLLDYWEERGLLPGFTAALRTYRAAP